MLILSPSETTPGMWKISARPATDVKGVEPGTWDLLLKPSSSRCASSSAPLFSCLNLDNAGFGGNLGQCWLRWRAMARPDQTISFRGIRTVPFHKSKTFVRLCHRARPVEFFPLRFGRKLHATTTQKRGLALPSWQIHAKGSTTREVNDVDSILPSQRQRSQQRAPDALHSNICGQRTGLRIVHSRTTSNLKRGQGNRVTSKSPNCGVGPQTFLLRNCGHKLHHRISLRKNTVEIADRVMIL